MRIITSSYDVSSGFQRYMQAIYSYMTAALGVTAISAWLASHTPAFFNAAYTIQNHIITGLKPLGWLIILAPLALIFLINFRLFNLSFAALRFFYWLYAMLVGLSLATIFLIYSDESIVQAFLVTSGMFAVMSIYGHITQRDLTSFGGFLFMALVGLILAMLANLWVRNTGFQLGIAAVAVVVFVALTAYDTQKLKQLYQIHAVDEAYDGKLVVMGALTLYLDMLNLFLNLLTLFGKRRK